jgi:hypothetical protein
MVSDLPNFLLIAVSYVILEHLLGLGCSLRWETGFIEL